MIVSRSRPTMIRSRSSDAFPYMAETARQARSVGVEREFFGGLEVFLRGLGG